MKYLVLINTLCLYFGLSSVGFAGGMGPVEKTENWYLVGGAGYSDPREVNITTDPGVWAFSISGYNSDMDSSAVLFFGVGRYITDAFRIDARIEHRGEYHYSKFQVSTTPGVGGVGDLNRTRLFDLDSNSVMINGWLDLGNLSSKLLWQAGGTVIQPFISGGAGVNYLNVKNFRTLARSANVPANALNEVFSANQLTTDNEFAWQVGAGLSAQLTPRTTLAIGYDYFDGGKIPFPNYIFTNPVGGRIGVTATPWNGSFQANEVYAELRVLV